VKEELNQTIAVLCMDTRGDGGVASVVKRQVEQLAQRYPVILLSAGYMGPLTPNLTFVKVEQRSYRWLRRFSHVPRELSFCLAAKKSLLDLSKRNRIALVICHSHALAALAARPLASLNRIPFALVTHADIFDRPEGTYDWRQTVFYKWVTPIAYKYAHVILAISEHMGKQASLRGAARERIRICNNGVDPDEIGLNFGESKEVSNQNGNEQFRVLYVGRLSPEKGVSDLVCAAAILKSRGCQISLRLVGDGPLRNKLEQMVVRKGLCTEVEFQGAKARKSLGQQYSRADITCVPSHSEPQGLVVLESMLSGTPVVAAATGGIVDMIELGKTGWLYPPRQPEMLADRIQDLMKNPEVLKKAGRLCREFVIENYSWAAIGKQLRAVIEEFWVDVPATRERTK
jgi:glycosyltransferase involved in cell wall biosynthesis